MIAIAAYYLAERRGFAPGGAEQDWAHAERVIDAMIASPGASPPRRGGGDVSDIVRNALKIQPGCDTAV